VAKYNLLLTRDILRLQSVVPTLTIVFETFVLLFEGSGQLEESPWSLFFGGCVANTAFCSLHAAANLEEIITY
jgi:hypothetical protein